MSDPADTTPPKRSLRERERDLEVRASLIDTRTTINFKESAQIIVRAASYLRYFVWRSVAKLAMTWVGRALPIFVLTWFGKILIDHVILGEPIEEAEQYPAYMNPVLDMLQGYSAFEIMIFLAIVGIGLMLLIGAYPGYRDEVEFGLMEGRDFATSTENAMHGGHSSLGAFYGFVEFTMNMRLTQALNHTVRSQVFSRIMGLSMTRLEDQRIGDSIYRVLYDTPQINEIFYQIVHTPVMTITLFIAAALTMMSAYPTVPELLWMSVVILPLWFLVSSLFAPIVRRRGQAARAAGAVTTSTIEEGMDNVLAVQSLGGNKKERGRFGDDSQESFKRHRIQSLVWMTIFWVNGAFNKVIELFFFCYVLLMVFDGELSVGDFGVLLGMIGQLRGRAQELAWIWIRFQDNVAAMRRIFAMMDLPPEDDLGRGALPPIREGVTMRRRRPGLPGWPAGARRRRPHRQGRRNRRIRRTHRRRQDQPRLPDSEIPRGDGRRGADRWTSRQRSDPRQPAQPGHLRVPGDAALPGLDPRQHPLRQAGRASIGGRAGGEDCRHPRLHHVAPRGLPDGAWHGDQQQDLGGPETAHRHRQGTAPGLPDPHPGRTDLRPRPRDRGVPGAVSARSRQGTGW